MDLDVQSYNIDHLGIVAGIFDVLKIGEVIDKVLPKQGSRNLPHSIIIKAMILHVMRQFSLGTQLIHVLLRSGSLERNSRRRDRLYPISSINQHSDPQ